MDNFSDETHISNFPTLLIQPLFKASEDHIDFDFRFMEYLCQGQPKVSLDLILSSHYRDIKERKKRRMVNNLMKSPRGPPLLSKGTTGPGGEEVPMFEMKPVKKEAGGDHMDVNGPIIPPVQIVFNEATSIIAQPSVSEGASSSQSVKSLRKTNCSVRKGRKENQDKSSSNGRSGPVPNAGQDHAEPASAGCCFQLLLNPNKSNNDTLSKNQERSSLQVPTISENNITHDDLTNNLESKNHVEKSNSPASTIHKQKKKDIRRKNEDSLAVVFMIIILIFLICHAPRIILDINELATIKKSEYCKSINAFPFSFWSIMIMNISHFLLVVNSSVNMIVYCLLGSRFRAEVGKIIDGIVCCCYRLCKSNPQNNND